MRSPHLKSRQRSLLRLASKVCLVPPREEALLEIRIGGGHDLLELNDLARLCRRRGRRRGCTHKRTEGTHKASLKYRLSVARVNRLY